MVLEVAFYCVPEAVLMTDDQSRAFMLRAGMLLCLVMALGPLLGAFVWYVLCIIAEPRD